MDVTAFFEAVGQYPLARNALVIALLASVSCGVVGTYVVTRRITYIAAAIAHCVLGGLGAARYLHVVHGWEFLTPLHGAFAAAIVAAAIIGAITLYTREREDTAIGAVWAIGMAAGILFMYQTPGYNQDLTSYLFGNILLVSAEDLWLVAVLDGAIVAIVWVFYAQLQAVCFDEEFVRLRGLRTEGYYLMLLMLIAVTVVLLVTVVGIVLVIALLTLPVAIASRFVNSLGLMMVLSCVLSAVFTVAGLSMSYGPDWPPGPVIIVLTGAAYAVAVGWSARRNA